MKAGVRPFLLAVLACALAACHAPDATMENGAITLYGDTVALRVAGSPQATIHADGALAIDGRTIATTPAERSLLVRYNQNVRSVHDTGVAMGKAGVGMAVKAILPSSSLTADGAGKTAEAGSTRMKQLSQDICRAVAAIKDAQDQLASQLAAFKPYASILGAANVTNCANDAKD